MVSIDEERDAAEQAEKAVRAIGVAAGGNVEATIKTLRNAKRFATSASADATFSSEGALNEARAEIAFAFGDLINALENGPLTAEKINRGSRAVEDWKNKLAVSRPSK